MPAKGKVSLTRQTIYCFIPIFDFYAAYKVMRLRWYLLIMLIWSFVSAVIGEIVNPVDLTENSIMNVESGGMDWHTMMFGEHPEIGITLMIINTVVTYCIAVYLIRRWSKKWNEKFPEY